MRIKNLLMLGAFLAMSGGTMAQTELTAGKVKVVPGFTGELTLNLTTPVEVGGWQMTLALPEGISVASEEGELVIGSSSSKATVFSDVALSRGKADHQVIGGVDSEGQTLLVCVPTAKEAAISGKSGELCKITLTADKSYKGKGTQTIKIKDIIAADPTGITTYTAENASFELVELKCDMTDDGTVDVFDVLSVIGLMATNPDGSKGGDFTGDNTVDVFDVLAVIAEMAE